MANWVPININTDVFNLSSGLKYLVDTSAGEVTLTFPEAPVTGDEIFIADSSDWSVNNLILISPNFNVFSTGSTTLVLKNKLNQYQFIYNDGIWLVYNTSLPTSKVSELPLVSNTFISEDDLLLYINKDSGAYESKSITYGNLKSNLNDTNYLTPQELIADLNNYTGTPPLDPKFLNGQPASYYLNYTNLTNRPIVPTALGQLSNNIGYITNLSSFDTDDLAEGEINKYLTQERFTTLFDTAFANSYRLYSGDFAETTVTNSIDNVSATPIVGQVGASTDVLQISPTLIDFFKPTQNIRIYGGDTDLEDITTIPVINSAVKNGFLGATGVSVQYKIAHFDFFTGKISASTAGTTIITDVDFSLSNISNNIQISYNRTSTNYGILLYRSINGGSYALIDILGQKELGSSLSNMSYRDYGLFNYTTWSRRNVNTGAYDVGTGTVHFPLTAPGSTQKGWVDAEIVSVDTATNRLILNANYYFNSTVIVSHNDTQRIQAAINQRVNAGINSLTLNDKRYIISQINVPTQFSIYGKGRDTILKKLSWSTETNNGIIAMSSIKAKNVNLSNFNIDGNMQNQWLKQDEFDVSLNYAINMKTESETVSIDKVHISNIIAGGIYVQKPTRLLINLSRVQDSGMNDFYEYSPLIGDDGSDVIITNNTFLNFSSAIDISLTLNGVFSSNVVENVGSGVLVFGSRFFISSQNVIKGPAGEFISGPDILNSVYDSINIMLEPGTSYTSDVYKYQENGVNFDLTANAAILKFSLDKLRKIDNAEELYGQILIGGNDPIINNPLQRVADVNLNPAAGEFKFSISQANVNALLSTYSYSTLKLADANHVGLVYEAILTEYVPSGTILPGATINGTLYNVSVIDYSNLYVGTKVRMLNYGGSPNLDTLIGTIEDIVLIPGDVAPAEANLTINYGQNINIAGTIATEAGVKSIITVEHPFVLAKGRIL